MLIPECAVHVVNIYPNEISRQLDRCEKLKLLEELVLWFVLAVVACGIDEQPERLVPEAACNLSAVSHKNRRTSNLHISR